MNEWISVDDQMPCAVCAISPRKSFETQIKLKDCSVYTAYYFPSNQMWKSKYEGLDIDHGDVEFWRYV